MRILIVDDDPWLARTLQMILEDAGFEVVVAADGASALRAVSEQSPDLVLLDLMLPGLDGAEVCRRIRRNSELPVIVLSAKSLTADKVDLLQLGADDYIAKPFEPEELIARVQAVLRRTLSGADDRVAGRIRVADIELDPIAATATAGDRAAIALTPTELRLLYTLMRNAGRVMTREMLRDYSWGYDYTGGANDVDVYVRRLRRKLEKDRTKPEYILTERGIGYKFTNQPPEVGAA